MNILNSPLGCSAKNMTNDNKQTTNHHRSSHHANLPSAVSSVEKSRTPLVCDRGECTCSQSDSVIGYAHRFIQHKNTRKKHPHRISLLYDTLTHSYHITFHISHITLHHANYYEFLRTNGSQFCRTNFILTTPHICPSRRRSHPLLILVPDKKHPQHSHSGYETDSFPSHEYSPSWWK